MLNKKNNYSTKMNEDNDYGQFTIIDIEYNEIGPRYKIYHIKNENDIENNNSGNKYHHDHHSDDDDPKKPNFKKNYFENTIYSATVILVLFMFVYFC